MALWNDIINTGGQVVNTIGGGINYAGSLLVRPPIQVVGGAVRQGTQFVGQVAAPYVQQGIRYAGQVPTMIQRPPIQVIAPAIIRAPQYIGGAVAPFARTAIQTIQRSPFSTGPTAIPVMIGTGIARAAAPAMVPLIRQAPAALSRAPIRVIAPLAARAPQMIGAAVAPFARQGAQMIRQQPSLLGLSALPVMIGTGIARAAAPTVVPIVRQAPAVLSRAPIQVFAPIIARAPQAIGAAVAPFARQGLETVRSSPQIFGMPQLPVMIGGAIARAAAPSVVPALRQASGGIGIFNPIPAARAATITPLSSGSSYRWENNWSYQQPVQTTRWSNSWSSEGPTISGGGMTSTPQGSSDVLGALGRLDILGAFGAAGNLLGGIRGGGSPAAGAQPQWDNKTWQTSSIGPDGRTSTSYGFSNNFTAQQNATAARPAPITDPGDNSTDVLGKLGRFDVIGAIGAGGKWIATNVPPAAEATGNWWSNSVQSGLNTGRVGGFNFFGGIGALERGELPAARKFDTDTQNFWQTNPVARGAYTLAMHRDPVGYDTTASLGRAGRMVNDDFLGSIASGMVMGVAGGIRFLGNVGGKLWSGDPAGAAGAVGEGATGMVMGTAQWGLGIPGRIATNPGRAIPQIAGEFIAGDLLFGAVGKGARGVKAGITPLGEATGLVRMKTYGFEHIPYKSPGAEVFDILHNEKTFNVARAVPGPAFNLEKVPGKILPRRSVSIRDPGSLGDVAAGAEGLFGTQGSAYLEGYGRYFERKPRTPAGYVAGRRLYVIPEVLNVRMPAEHVAKIDRSITTTGQFWEHYPEVIRTAQEQSRQTGQPIGVPTPKRARGFPEPENEIFLVFGDAVSQRIAQTQFAGFAPRSLTQVKKLALGTQKLESTRRGNLRENLAYNWDIGRSGATFYNRNYLRAMTGDMGRKYGELYGRDLMYPGQYGAHGAEHATAVSGNLETMRRQNPTLQAAASPADLWARGTYHDLAKVGQGETQPLRHGFAAGEAIRTGMFSTPELAAMEPTARLALARDIQLHTRIDPRPYTYRGLRTMAIDRPSVSAKALANADRMDLTRLGATVKSSRLFELPRGQAGAGGGRSRAGEWLFDQPVGVIEPGLSRIMTWEAAGRRTASLYEGYTPVRGFGSLASAGLLNLSPFDSRFSGKMAEQTGTSFIPCGGKVACRLDALRGTNGAAGPVIDMPRYGAYPRRSSVQTAAGSIFSGTGRPEIDMWTTGTPPHLADLMGELRERGSRPARHETAGYSRRGTKAPTLEMRSDLEPWMRSPLEADRQFFERPRMRTYETRRGTGAYPARGREYGANLLSYDRSYGPSMAVGSLSYGKGAKGEYGPGYEADYTGNLGYSPGYGRSSKSGYMGQYRTEYGSLGGYGYGGSGYGRNYKTGGSGYGGNYGNGGYGYGENYKTGGYGSGGYGYGGRYRGGGYGFGGYGYGGQYQSRYISKGGFSFGGQYNGGYSSRGGYSFGGQAGVGYGWKFDYGSGGYSFGGGRAGTLQNRIDQEEIRGRRKGGRSAYDFTELSGIETPEAILKAGGRQIRKKTKKTSNLFTVALGTLKARRAAKRGAAKPAAPKTRKTAKRAPRRKTAARRKKK